MCTSILNMACLQPYHVSCLILLLSMEVWELRCTFWMRQLLVWTRGAAMSSTHGRREDLATWHVAYVAILCSTCHPALHQPFDRKAHRDFRIWKSLDKGWKIRLLFDLNAQGQSPPVQWFDGLKLHESEPFIVSRSFWSLSLPGWFWTLKGMQNYKK